MKEYYKNQIEEQTNYTDNCLESVQVGIEKIPAKMFYNNEDCSMIFYPSNKFDGLYKIDSENDDFQEIEPLEIIKIHNGLILICPSDDDEKYFDSKEDIKTVYRCEPNFMRGYTIFFKNCTREEADTIYLKYNEGEDGYGSTMYEPVSLPIGYVFETIEAYND